MNWTITRAAPEFGTTRETLKRRIASVGLPSKAKYTTKEVVKALFGDMAGEKLRLTREQADKLALDNAETRSDLVSSIEEQAIVERGLSAMTQAVLAAANLEDEDKDKILNHLRDTGQSVVSWLRGSKTTSTAEG